MTVKTREFHNGFECAVYYRDDDNDSGYGEHAQVAYWYGPFSESPAEPISSKDWRLVCGHHDVDPFDLACEHRYD